MDVRNGRIHSNDEVGRMTAEDRAHMRPMAIDPTPHQLRAGAVGRNHACPCGSGRKFKRCCLARPHAAAR